MPIDVITLTQNLIRCPSVTPLDAGAIEVVIQALEPLGFTCTRLKFGDIENLFARRGTESPHFCFVGHTDVVPPGDEKAWNYPPFAAAIADGKIYGRGASDMKGNIAAFIAAVSDMPAVKGSISLLITGDEEGPAVNGTVKVLEWMAQNGHTPDVALVGEPTNPDQMGEEIKIGRRGSLSGTLTVRGIQGHVAYPHRADNPIPKLARMIHALSALTLDSGSAHFGPSTLQVTNIHVGNTVDNVIPGQASAKFNIRFNDQWNAANLEDKIRFTLNAVSPDYTLILSCGAESFITQPGDFTTLVSDAVQSVTGRTPQLSTGGGTSDARFVQKYCPVVECGVTNKTIHQVDEHVSVDDLQTLQKIYQDILTRYFSA
ncbi:MAG: succinyl-diaminopimelate desuccinylase [Micavibrio sp.]